MADCARLLIDIDRRIAHISTQVDMGAERDEVVTEQYNALLSTFSMLRSVELETITRISTHLVAADVFARHHLLAFSASLRATLSAARRDKPTTRKMQRNDALEHYLLESDWNRLEELGKQPKQNSDPLEEIVAIRMHLLGIVCPDASTLKRASAIVQVVMPGVNATAKDTREYLCGVRNKLKKLDRGSKWAFAYVSTYPRSPF